MKQNIDISRRNFLKSATAAGAVVAVGGLGFLGCSKKPEETASNTAAPPAGGQPPAQTQPADGQPAQLPMLSESDPVAKSLGYHEDATKVDTTKWTKRAGPEGAKQTCANCAQFQGINAESGRCTIFPTGLVKPGGWCNTWVQKAS